LIRRYRKNTLLQHPNKNSWKSKSKRYFCRLDRYCSNFVNCNALFDGRTVQNVFQIPLNLNETSTSSMSLHSKKDKTLIGADLIIWDEAPMAALQALNTIDRFLKQQKNNNLPFGGKNIVWVVIFVK
jgi:hypothetical protein